MKQWNELTLADNFIFQKVMLNEELCKKILSEILDKEVVRIEYPDYEKSIRINRDSKSIRLDVYIKNEEDVYNLEIQNYVDKELPKRSRYYSSVMDLEMIERGSYYTELNNNYVIFICTYDPFGLNEYRYKFENCCKNCNGMELKDGTQKIFLNTKGTKGDISDDLKNFLECVNGVYNSSSISATIKEEINKVMCREEWRVEYMNQFIHDEDIRRASRSEGIKLGEQKGRIEEQRQAICRMLQKLSVDDIVDLGYERSLVEQIAKEK